MHTAPELCDTYYTSLSGCTRDSTLHLPYQSFSVYQRHCTTLATPISLGVLDTRHDTCRTSLSPSVYQRYYTTLVHQRFSVCGRRYTTVAIRLLRCTTDTKRYLLHFSHDRLGFRTSVLSSDSLLGRLSVLSFHCLHGFESFCQTIFAGFTHFVRLSCQVSALLSDYLLLDAGVDAQAM